MYCLNSGAIFSCLIKMDDVLGIFNGNGMIITKLRNTVVWGKKSKKKTTEKKY